MTRLRGNILVESVFALSALSLSVAAATELVRRSWYEIALAQGAFLSARAAGLGASPERARAEAGRFLEDALGRGFARAVLRHTARDPRPWPPCEARLSLRYPALARFALGDITRHHFEITRSCRFSCSR